MKAAAWLLREGERQVIWFTNFTPGTLYVIELFYVLHMIQLLLHKYQIKDFFL